MPLRRHGNYYLRVVAILCVISCTISFTSCGGTMNPTSDIHPGADCAGAPTTSLSVYDSYSARFADIDTTHPSSNLGGQVVWNTRYYLESLITAYEATGNQ